MSRFVFALFCLTFLMGGTGALVSEARAAAVCDVNACISARSKRTIGSGGQRCNSNCQIDVAENKKKGLCK